MSALRASQCLQLLCLVSFSPLTHTNQPRTLITNKDKHVIITTNILMHRTAWQLEEKSQHFEADGRELIHETHLLDLSADSDTQYSKMFMKMNMTTWIFTKDMLKLYGFNFV